MYCTVVYDAPCDGSSMIATGGMTPDIDSAQHGAHTSAIGRRPPTAKPAQSQIKTDHLSFAYASNLPIYLSVIFHIQNFKRNRSQDWKCAFQNFYFVKKIRIRARFSISKMITKCFEICESQR